MASLISADHVQLCRKTFPEKGKLRTFTLKSFDQVPTVPLHFILYLSFWVFRCIDRKIWVGRKNRRIGWTKGQTERRIDGMGEWMNGRTDGWMDNWMNGSDGLSRWMGRAVGWIDRQIYWWDGWMDKWICGCVDGWMLSIHLKAHKD